MNTNWKGYLEEHGEPKVVRARSSRHNIKKNAWESYLIRHKPTDYSFNRYLINRMEERRRISGRYWSAKARKLSFQLKYGNIRAN